eukprot:gene11420-12766_t
MGFMQGEVDTESMEPPDDLPPSKRPRTQSRSTAIEMPAEPLTPSGDTDYSSVVLRWNNLCCNDLVKHYIHLFVWNLNKIALEAYHVANLHVLRVFAKQLKEKELPEINQKFFNQCCTGVATTRIRGNSTIDDNLKSTLEIFRTLRPVQDNHATVRMYCPPEKTLMTNVVTTLARDMNTACQNHLVMNFGPRLVRYVCLKYRMKPKAAKSFITRAFWVGASRCDNPEQRAEFTQWLGKPPTHENIKKNFNYFLRKSFEILQFMESQPPRTKDARTFTLIPLKAGFVLSSITLSNCCFQQILQRIIREENSKERAMARIEKREHVPFTLFGCKSIPEEVFNKNKRFFWDSAFKIEKLETANRKFAGQISTNGYSVSVLLAKPKRSAWHNYNVHTEFEFERVIGADPGVINVLVAKPSEGKTIKISTAEYRHLTKMHRHRYWHENLKKREPRYAQLIRDMPSFAVSSVEMYMNNLRYVLQHCDELFTFCADKAFRKWRFSAHVQEQKALHTLCKRLTEGKKTCIGMGDWSKQDGGFLKRNPPAPVKKLQAALRRYATVIILDEHKTSKMCSLCQRDQCVQIRLPAKKKKKKKKDGGEEEVEEEANERQPVKLVRSHDVVRYRSNECAMCWQRDVNSANNHLVLIQSLLRGEERPEYLRRGPTHLNSLSTRV